MLSEPSKQIVVPASKVGIYLTTIYSFQFTMIVLALIPKPDSYCVVNTGRKPLAKEKGWGRRTLLEILTGLKMATGPQQK